MKSSIDGSDDVSLIVHLPKKEINYTKHSWDFITETSSVSNLIIKDNGFQYVSFVLSITKHCTTIDSWFIVKGRESFCKGKTSPIFFIEYRSKKDMSPHNLICERWIFSPLRFMTSLVNGLRCWAKALFWYSLLFVFTESCFQSFCEVWQSFTSEKPIPRSCSFCHLTRTQTIPQVRAFSYLGFFDHVYNTLTQKQAHGAWVKSKFQIFWLLSLNSIISFCLENCR